MIHCRFPYADSNICFVGTFHNSKDIILIIFRAKICPVIIDNQHYLFGHFHMSSIRLTAVYEMIKLQSQPECIQYVIIGGSFFIQCSINFFLNAVINLSNLSGNDDSIFFNLNRMGLSHHDQIGTLDDNNNTCLLFLLRSG